MRQNKGGHTISLIDFVFPRRCPVCHDVVRNRGRLICDLCRPQLSYVKEPRCLKCGKEIGLDTDEYCYDCKEKPKPFERNIALFNYDEIMQGSMVHFKYKGRREYARFYAQELFDCFEEELRKINPSLILPVPVHKSRRAERGYNQAEEIARELCKLMNEKWEGKRVQMRSDILTREKKTVAQKKLDAGERAKNIYSAMKVHYDLRSCGNILLIDDIYTTGSTISACTRALKAAGARRVYTATVCIGRDS